MARQTVVDMDELELIILARLFLRRIVSKSQTPIFLAPKMVARTMSKESGFLISSVDTPANTSLICLPIDWVPFWEDLSLSDRLWVDYNPHRVRALLDSAVLATDGGTQLTPLCQDEYTTIAKHIGLLPIEIMCLADNVDMGQPGSGARLLGHRSVDWDHAFKGEL